MPFNNGPHIWFDGKMVPWEDATLHVTAHALHYGSSVFEGIRTYETVNGSAIFRLEPHMRRLVRSCKLARIALPWTQEQLMQATIDVVESNGQASCYIRPLVFRGSEQFGVDGRACPTQVAIMSIDWGRYLGPKGLSRAWMCESVRGGGWLPAPAWRWAKSAGSTSTVSSWSWKRTTKASTMRLRWI